MLRFPAIGCIVIRGKQDEATREPVFDPRARAFKMIRMDFGGGEEEEVGST